MYYLVVKNYRVKGVCVEPKYDDAPEVATSSRPIQKFLRKGNVIFLNEMRLEDEQADTSDSAYGAIYHFPSPVPENVVIRIINNSLAEAYISDMDKICGCEKIISDLKWRRELLSQEYEREPERLEDIFNFTREDGSLLLDIFRMENEIKARQFHMKELLQKISKSA